MSDRSIVAAAVLVMLTVCAITFWFQLFLASAASAVVVVVGMKKLEGAP